MNVCKPLIFDDAARAVAHWRNLADADGSGDEAASKRCDRAAHARLHASETLDGTTVIDGVLDPVAGEIFSSFLPRGRSGPGGDRPSRQPANVRASLRVSGEHGADLAVGSRPS